MIQARELRLGNWIMTPAGITFRVDSMEHWGSDYNKVGMKQVGYSMHTWDLIDMSPIPLTEDILLKCGFEKNEYTSHKSNEFLPHYIRNMDMVDFTKGMIRIKLQQDGNSVWIEDEEGCIKLDSCIEHLHELQNFYYWHNSKTELEITNL